MNSNPDGSGRLVPEATHRLPGRMDAGDTFISSTGLAAAHVGHEKRADRRVADGPDWYVEDIVREQVGKELPS